MKYHEMTKNYIFHEFECGLSIEQTTELCFKSVGTVKEWDKGKDIPKERKRLMRNQKLELPTGQRVTPQETLAGIGLLEIRSELELKTNLRTLKFARAIACLLK